jgi:hypothetical protein
MSDNRASTVLDWRDAPDSIEEYCQYLGAALRAHDFALELARVSRIEDNWPAAMREIEHQAGAYRGC